MIIATLPNQNQGFSGFAKVEKSSKIDPEGLWNSTFLEVYVELLSFSIFDKILIDFWMVLESFLLCKILADYLIVRRILQMFSAFMAIFAVVFRPNENETKM